MRRSALSLAFLLGTILSPLALLVAVNGCSKAPATGPQGALSRDAMSIRLESASRGGMDSLWPNDDGHFWQYRLDQRSSPATLEFYDNPADVPPAPSVWDVAALLRSESRGKDGPPSGGATESGTWRLQFNGRVTTQSGAEGQNLTETLLADPSPGAIRTRAKSRVISETAVPAFWSHLAAARPDLAPDLQSRLGPAVRSTPDALGRPILLHGGAWEKTAEHIGTYGDLGREIAWLYLVADVQPGATFDLQLVPELASDVYLHALVLPSRYATHPAPAPHAVEVLYLIDYGVSDARGPSGEDLGAFRSIEYGTVTYVPEVGPVASFDRSVFPGPDLPPAGTQIETSLSLTASGPGSPSDLLPTNDSPQGAIARLIQSYEGKLANEYTGMFTGDYTYEFSVSTDPTLVQQYATGWFKTDEVESATHLFNGYTPPGGATLPAASSIDIQLANGIPTDDNTSGVDPVTHKVLATRVDGSITVPQAGSEPLTYVLTNNYNVFYLVRGDVAVGLDSSQPADSGHWYVYRWVDLSQASGLRAQSISPTWGRIKAAYR